ncbi:MAG: 4-alpha-glucanotransferase (amylomaltase) [Bryobacterales bacterium]|nr:4-alpha-glucanotransferase (amylomaltase) [Bryobacterales bacterium]
MKFPRSSGILLHPTSLPGPFGIGDLGPEAFAFADFLHAAGQTLWQMLPLGPTGYGDSPYQLFSAFAGNPLLISPEKLVLAGSLTAADLACAPPFPESEVDFSQVIPWKNHLLARAHENFRGRASDTDINDFDSFCSENASWLDDYSLFIARKEDFGLERSWTEWPSDPGAPARLATRIDAIKYAQFEFFRQWTELKAYCYERNILLMGDVPIYVAHDSSDVWSHRDLFQLNERGEPLVVAGVPPDYFSATGQLWGNPIYRWDAIERTGFAWWIERLRAAFATFDVIRLDHFRGFEAYWEVPANEPTAVNGRWVKAPGTQLFETVRKVLGEVPVVAENLGVITPEVEALRERFGFPGMAVLQFGFGSDPQAPDFRPHNYPRERFAYSGTHDNDTTIGWWTSAGAGDSTRSAEDVEKERRVALDYLNTDGSEMNWAFIRTLMASVASDVIFPLQDVLGLGSEARMNTPGKGSGNWRWRFPHGALTRAHADHLSRLAKIYERAS